MKIGYPGQHLASLALGMEGVRTGARGHDIIDGSEVKSCSRVDQLDTCGSCGEKVMRIETICSNCNSESIKRMDDSKWLFTIRSENDLKVLTEDVERIVLTIADYPNFSKNDFTEIRFQIFEIWTKSPKSIHFKSLMINYYHKIYLEHKTSNPTKTPAPKNFWPYSYQFYMCNPIKILSCIVKNANTKPEVIIEYFVEPSEDRGSLKSEPMPIKLLSKEELTLIAKSPQLIMDSISSENFLSEVMQELEKPKPNLSRLEILMPYLSENARMLLPLRETDKISESKLQYQRK